MKTEQEQTKQMLKTLCDKFQCSAIDRSYMAKSCRQCEDIIEALHEAGYGDISEYKAEIESLEQLNAIQCDAWQKVSDENESLIMENNSNLRYNSALRKENKKLEAENQELVTSLKQAQVDTINTIVKYCENLNHWNELKDCKLWGGKSDDLRNFLNGIFKEIENDRI